MSLSHNILYYLRYSACGRNILIESAANGYKDMAGHMDVNGYISIELSFLKSGGWRDDFIPSPTEQQKITIVCWRTKFNKSLGHMARFIAYKNFKRKE